MYKTKREGLTVKVIKQLTFIEPICRPLAKSEKEMEELGDNKRFCHNSEEIIVSLKSLLGVAIVPLNLTVNNKLPFWIAIFT